MKESEFVANVLAGKPLLLVEYRSFVADEIVRKVPKAGQSATMPIIKHKVLLGDDSWELGEFLDDGQEVKSYKSQFRARDLVAVQVETMEKTKWGSRMNGVMLGKLEK